MKLSTPLKSVFVASSLFLTTTAIADDEYGVTYKASELASAQGVSEVHARIVTVAKNYCPSYREAGSLRELKVCLVDVTNDLVGKINHPTLSSYHDRENGVEIANLTRQSPSDRG